MSRILTCITMDNSRKYHFKCHKPIAFPCQRDMPNYEKVAAFFERAVRGENAFVTVYSVRVYETVSVNGTLYGKDETGFYELPWDLIFEEIWERENGALFGR